MGILDDAIREHLELKRRRGADASEVERQEREILAGEPGATAAAPAADAAAAVEAVDEVFEGYEEQPVLSGSPILEEEPIIPPSPNDLFPSTGELLAAASGPAPLEAAAPSEVAAPAPAPEAPVREPAPAGADSETAARSGARRLSDEELAAWRRRLSERADRLAAQRAAGDAPAAPAAPAAAAPAPEPAAPAPAPAEAPAASWSAPAPATPAGGAAEAPAEDALARDFFDAGEADQAFGADPVPEAGGDEHDVLDETPDFLQETPEHDRMWFEQRPPRDFDFG